MENKARIYIGIQIGQHPGHSVQADIPGVSEFIIDYLKGVLRESVQHLCEENHTWAQWSIGMAKESLLQCGHCQQDMPLIMFKASYTDPLSQYCSNCKVQYLDKKYQQLEAEKKELEHTLWLMNNPDKDI